MEVVSNPFALIIERLERIEKLLSEQQAKQVEQPHHSIDEADLLTPKETAQLLRISIPTLWRWEKKGKVKCYGIGGKRYYKRSELIESLTKKN